jgi:hypothetical protein
MPIQDEPESTVGRRPDRWEPTPGPGQPASRSGAAIRREEGDETEAAGEIREREEHEPPPIVGLEE